MSAGKQALIWGVSLVVFGFVLHLLGPILLPFVFGLVVAYLFDPVVTWLQARGLSRTLGTMIVLILFGAVIVVAIAVLAPVIQTQLVELVNKAPDLIANVQVRLQQLLAQVSDRLSPENADKLKSAVGSVVGDATKFLGQLIGQIWSGGLALLNLLSLIFISPVVAFFVLRDWPGIVDTVDQWLPRDHAPTIRGLAREADTMIAGYMRGAAMVCLILAAFYATGLTLIGLEFSLLIGIGAGLISFIPFVGAAVGFIVSVGVALAQFDDPTWIVVTAGIFVAGQALEGNFLTPKMVGDRIGLHPVWVIFALLAGGLLFGFTGVLLAVPVAAVIGVLARFSIAKYMDSTLYQGGGGGAP